jgi:UDP-2,3-diacylglucosamine pyrophosphatase LpxH
MLVFISDIHLTDGTSGTTISPNAFKLLSQQLAKLVADVGDTTELKLVLLGDIFDVIRSTKWLDPAVTVRPWDAASPTQQTLTDSIVADIIAKNAASISWIKRLQDLTPHSTIQYVIGNHDWLINRYPAIAAQVAAALGVTLADNRKFPTEIFEPAYRTIARHGDIHDQLNFMSNRDQSSIGDAIVIELLNKFPLAVARRLPGQPAIVNQLKEIDNVRPLLDVPSWVLMASSRAPDPVRQAITGAWQECVDEFFEVPFIQKMDIPFWPDTIDLLRIALQLSSHTSKWLLEKIIDLKKRFLPAGTEGNYPAQAWAEPKIRGGEADYVVYGHTHEHLIVPLGQITSPAGDPIDKVYFNTGTWRQTWNKTTCDAGLREFVGWKVLTYIAFYNRDENDNYDFEVWNGALG